MVKKIPNYLFEMSNIRGKYVKVPHKLDFSFYFSPKNVVADKDAVHGLRVKPVFNPEKMSISKAGTLKLHSDWKYIPGEDDTDVSSKQIKEMCNFFKTYKTLFAAVWEEVLPQDALYDYLRGTITFKELLTEFDFYANYKEELADVNSIEELTDFVRINNLFNLWED